MALILLSGTKKKRKYFFFNWQLKFHSWGISKISFLPTELSYMFLIWFNFGTKELFYLWNTNLYQAEKRKKSLMGDREELQCFQTEGTNLLFKCSDWSTSTLSENPFWNIVPAIFDPRPPPNGPVKATGIVCSPCHRIHLFACCQDHKSEMRWVVELSLFRTSLKSVPGGHCCNAV